MGLAFQSISKFHAPPLFQTLISEGVVTSQVFGLKLASSGSELFLGGTNSALFTGDFTWVSLTNEVCDGPKNIDLLQVLIRLPLNRVSG
jgi:cathepsin D